MPIPSAELLAGLNAPQRAAVTTENRALLVLAGAGSGKTRVLVHRMAWLIETGDCAPHSLLAVTFTNKAAAEMRGRIERLLAMSTRGLWIGTFHSLAHRLLRTHWQAAGLPENFQILDSDDQLRLVKRVLKDLNIDSERWSPRQCQHYLNQKKDQGLRAAQIQPQGDFFEETQQRIYLAYETACQTAGLVDFAELLLRAHELFETHPDLLAHYRARFRHVLVDEFQDTNGIQYAWVQKLVGDTNAITIVGDDDQSIYGWRGARIENITRFQIDYDPVTVIRLEQNYRSSQNILSAANALIACNTERMGKSLWTDGDEGAPVSVYTAFNEYDEANFILNTLQDQLASQGLRREEIAILYRSNAQSRILEETLLKNGVPYRVFGGLRFFERTEIKDALAYLRLIVNRQDDAALERVINTPTRGIGTKTLALMRETALSQSISLWAAAQVLLNEQRLTARAANALHLFLGLIETLEETLNGLPLSEQVASVIEASNLAQHYLKEGREKAQSRRENLDELISAARTFVPETIDAQETEDLRAAFLAAASLDSGETQADDKDAIQLMTLHTAKGLEFPLVFITGLEEGLFPHSLSADDPQRLAEERRLCYVGMTRAMQRLYLTHSEARRLHGTERYNRPSRFLQELPQEELHWLRLKTKVYRTTEPATSLRSPVPQATTDSGYYIGQPVRHPKFGEGTILSFEGNGAHTRVQVSFTDAGTKWLVASYARLEEVF